MIDAGPFSNLLAYSAQVACLVALAGLVSWLFRVDAAAVRYAWWRAVLAASLALPWLQGRRIEKVATGTATTTATVVATASDGVAATASATFPWPTLVITILVGGASLRLLWLAVNLWRLRRLRALGQPAPAGAHDDTQRALGTRAEVRYVAGLDQPATFGVRRPVVLLPEALWTQPAPVQHAVLCHELLHVRRRDWAWLLGEEVVRAALWFHPAIWWLVSRVQLAREEVVDTLVVRATGARRTYVEALMTFADGARPAPAAPFAERRHLFRRILLICKEAPMSRRRVVFSGVMATAIVVAGALYATSAFPLAQSAPAGQESAGALEAQANPIAPENPIPRRLYAPTPAYPAAATGSGIRGTVNLRVTLDASGQVAEVRRQQIRLTNPTNLPQVSWLAMMDAFVESASAAVRQWRYDPPAEPPITFEATFRFEPDGETRATQTGEDEGPGSFAFTSDRAGNVQISRLDPLPAPPPPAPFSNGALRVGDDLPPPTKVRNVPPLYPDRAQELRVGGVVVLEIVVDETGRVADARVTRSIPVLDEAALDAVRQWEYEPTRLNGVPVSIVMNVTVNFALS